MTRSHADRTDRFPLAHSVMWRCALAVTLILFLGAIPFAAHAQESPAKRVLLISTGSRLGPGFLVLDQQILEALGKITSATIETYAENLDVFRFPAARSQRLFNEYLAEKYGDRPPDLVILVFVGDLAIHEKVLAQVFPHTPIVVGGLTEEELASHQFGPLVSGLAQRHDPRATLELMLRLQPGLRRVVVIGGKAEVDRQLLQRVETAAASFRGRVDIEFWDNLRMAEIRERVTSLPPQTAILYTRLFQDAAGQDFSSSEIGQWIGRSANAPVYVLSDAALGSGAVGGSIASIEAFGKRAGELARLILTGTPPQSLPFEIRTDTVPTFDWRALKRWGISELLLPANSVVRFKPQSIWALYRWYIVGALLIIFVQSAMIVALIVQRREAHRMQAALQQSQQLIELATEAGELGLWSRNLTTGDVWVNASLRSLFCFGAHDRITFDDVIDRIHPDDRAGFLVEAERTQAAGLPFHGEYRIRMPDGAERWVLAKGRTVRGPGGHESHRMGAVFDIGERKRAEQSLHQQRAFLRQVIDVNPNFIFAKDREGRFTLANQALAEACGLTVDDLIGKTDADFNSNREEVEFFRRVDAEVMTTLQERFIREERFTDARGKVRWLQTVKRPIIGPDGAATQVLAAATDITERRRTEMELQKQRAELAHVARVSLMGELVASLAHELSQPLTAILGNAKAGLNFIEREPADMKEVGAALADIFEANNRATEVIRRIRALVKKDDEVEFETVDLPSVIREVAGLVHGDALMQDIGVRLELDGVRLPVKGNRVQLQQVVLNILLNAFDAIKECPPGERTIRLRAERDANGMGRVAVSDCGAGLKPDELDRIFEPFYTTKREGLGMGLSICRSIVEGHGGRLWAEDNPGRGATFYFTVPIDGNDPRTDRAYRTQTLSPAVGQL